MSYGVLVTFDLKNASWQDYANVYADLEKLGLQRVAVGSNGNTTIPTTTVMGFGFSGASSDSVAVWVRGQVAAALSARRLSSEIFVFAGQFPGWASINT